jgi:hypothetical protein
MRKNTITLRDIIALASAIKRAGPGGVFPNLTAGTTGRVGMTLQHPSTTSHLWGVLLILCIICSRIPFLQTGYGSDPDAWRVASTAKTLWQEGRYEVSRWPGYPLHEIVSAPLIAAGGSSASNGATLLITIAATWVWFRICQENARHRNLLVIAFAFFPLIWKNSAATMDYVWSLFFLLLALWFVLRHREAAAGLMMGVAIGFRGSNGIILMPLLALIFLRGFTWDAIARFLLVTLLAGAVSFSPVIFTYGVAQWFQETRAQIDEVFLRQDITIFHFAYRAVYAVGPLALMMAAILFLRKGRVMLQRVQAADPIVVASLLGIALPLVVFWRMPFEREYLMPAIPFALLLMDRIVSRREMLWLVLSMVCFAFVNPDVIRHHGMTGSPGWNMHTGIVIEEWQKRNDLLHQLRTIPTMNIQSRSVVMTGLLHPFWIETPTVAPDTSALAGQFHEPLLRNTSRDSLYYILLLTTDEIQRARRLGYRIACTTQAQAYVGQVGGYTLEEEGVEVVAGGSTEEHARGIGLRIGN